MLIQAENQKLPSAFNKSAKKYKNQFRILIPFLLIIVLASLFYFSNRNTTKKLVNRTSNNEKIKENDSLPDFPSTSPAHISDIYSPWSLSTEFKEKLWEAVKKSPINSKTGRHYIIYFVANAGMIDFILNSLCSMQFIGIPKNAHVSIALDQQAYDAISNIGEPVILLTSNFTRTAVNNNHIVDFYNIIKVKPTILHQFLLWNVEPILVDIDTVFLQNPFHIFNDEADFEVQCDSKEYYRIPNTVMPVPWQVNLGFYKVHPTQNVMKFMPHWLKRMYNATKVHDQSSLRKVLKSYHTFWISDDTILVDTTRLLGEDYPNLTFRFLDPMLITNAGGLYQEGAEDWKKEAKLRKLNRPEFIHFFHIGRIYEKRDLITENDLWFINREKLKCLKARPNGAIDFKAWKS